MRAVEMTPVDMPAISASPRIEVSSLPATVAWSPRTTPGPAPMTPESVLMPVCSAVAVPAESGTCMSMV